MGEFYGSLQEVGLPEILTFLKGLGKTGSLRISQGHWTAEASLTSGRVTGASFAGEQGVAALEAIMLGLPGGSFTFTDGEPRPDRTFGLTPDELQTRLSAFARERSRLSAAVPSLGAVPRVAKAPGTGGEVVLDGAAIETLLAVNGERSIAEIASDQGLVQTARELTKLLDNGLINIDVPEAEAAPPHVHKDASPSPVSAVSPISPIKERPTGPEVRQASANPAAEAGADAKQQRSNGLPAQAVHSAEPLAARSSQPPVAESPAAAESHEGQVDDPEVGTPEAGAVALAASGPCPKLGYVDDPANRYSRPTQLHRCFASGVAERVSTPEQRDLCLTNRYPSCPRFIAAGATAPPPAAPVQASSRAEVEAPPVPTSAGRPDRPDARPVRDSNAGGGGRSFPSREGAAPVAVRPAVSISRPFSRPAAPAQELSSTVARERSARTETPAPPTQRPSVPTDPASRVVEPAAALRPSSPRRLLPAVVLVTVVAIATLAVVIIRANPQLPDVTPEEVSRLATSVAVNQRPNPSAAQPPAGSEPVAAVPAASDSGLRTMLDVNFSQSPAGWPTNPSSTAWFGDGGYHVFARQPGEFVAIGAPTTERFDEMVVSATFRKVGGPAGGGYGFIIRDQGPGPRDGLNQNGQYYVLEVGDRGEYGIWRREGDQWLDLIPWTPSDLVPPGDAANEVTVQASGQELTFLVNGKVLANLVGAVLRDGGVGIFVGGDLNEVVVERLAVQVPS
jgi:hypothetical protein